MPRCLFLIGAFAVIGCSTPQIKEFEPVSSDPRSIEQIFEQLPESDPVEMAMMENEFLDEDPQLTPASIQAQLQDLSLKLVSKEAQLGHFEMLDDNLWKNQSDVLRGEIEWLRNQKAQLEQQLQRINQ